MLCASYWPKAPKNNSQELPLGLTLPELRVVTHYGAWLRAAIGYANYAVDVRVSTLRANPGHKSSTTCGKPQCSRAWPYTLIERRTAL